VGRFVRTTALVACVLALAAVAGCGADEQASGSLDTALAYAPRESPFLIALETDLEAEQYDALDSILRRFPLGGDLEELLTDRLRDSAPGLDFGEDVKPLLGNPLVVAATSAQTLVGGSGDGDFVAAIEVDDRSKLEDLIEKTNADQRGQAAGATIYEDEGTLFAVDGDVVVLAADEQQLEAALERADRDDHLDEQVFDEALADPSEDGIARIYVNLRALIDSDPDAREAKSVAWVDALRTLGVTASVDRDAVELEFNLRTEADGLSEDDLPLAAGDEAPPVIERDGEIGFGVRDPSQIVKFAEAAAQAVDPAGFGQYARAKKMLDARLDIDIDEDLIGQLSGDVAATLSVGGDFGLRAELEDPARFERTLVKAAPELPRLAESAGAGALKLERRGDLYVLAERDGDGVAFSVLNDVFVLANDLAGARRLANEQPVEVPGAEGAVVVSADAQQVANEVLGRLELGPGGGFAQLFTGPLGRLSGSVSATTEGVKGKITLELD
jgi:hypothetical protein